jgi:hypothetical protein
LDAQAEVAPHVQDDFDLEEGVLQELAVKDNPDFQVSMSCHRKDLPGMGVSAVTVFKPMAMHTGETAETSRLCTHQGLEFPSARQEVPRTGHRLHHL